MKIALTGATGFVGMNLMPLLLKETDANNEYLTLNRDVEKANRLYPIKQYSKRRFIFIATIVTYSNNSLFRCWIKVFYCDIK